MACLAAMSSFRVGLVLSITVPLVVALACNPGPTATPPKAPDTEVAPAPEPGTLSAEVLGVMDEAADPCQDFYRFACGEWLDKTDIPSDQSRYGRFNALRDQNQATLHEILEAALADANPDPEVARLAAFYGACMDEQAVQTNGTAGIAPQLELVAGIGNKQAADGGTGPAAPRGRRRAARLRRQLRLRPAGHQHRPLLAGRSGPTRPRLLPARRRGGGSPAHRVRRARRDDAVPARQPRRQGGRRADHRIRDRARECLHAPRPAARPQEAPQRGRRQGPRQAHAGAALEAVLEGDGDRAAQGHQRRARVVHGLAVRAGRHHAPVHDQGVPDVERGAEQRPLAARRFRAGALFLLRPAAARAGRARAPLEALRRRDRPRPRGVRSGATSWSSASPATARTSPRP